jgi:hypothetical protein
MQVVCPSRVHTGSMSKVRLGMCLHMETNILKRTVKMILVRCVVILIMDARLLGNPGARD